MTKLPKNRLRTHVACCSDCYSESGHNEEYSTKFNARICGEKQAGEARKYSIGREFVGISDVIPGNS